MPELSPDIISTIFKEFFNLHQKTLIDYAAPHSIEELLRSFVHGRATMQDLLDGLSDVKVAFRPDPQAYSISQIITHVIAAQGNTYNAVLDLAVLVVPHIEHPPLEPGGGAVEHVSVLELRRRLTEATEELSEIFREAGRTEHQSIRIYPLFGPMNAKSWMLSQIFHDLDHIHQAQALRGMAAFPTL